MVILTGNDLFVGKLWYEEQEQTNLYNYYYYFRTPLLIERSCSKIKCMTFFQYSSLFEREFMVINASTLRRLLILAFILFQPLLCFAEKKHIFFFHTYSSSPSLPWMKSISEGVEEALIQRPDWILHSEYMDWDVAGDSLSEQEWFDYISRKYQNIRFSAVLSEASLPSAFLNTYGEELFGDVPKVMYSVEKMERKPNSYYFKHNQDQSVIDTFHMAMQQNPGSRKIVIVNNLKKTFDRAVDQLQQLADQHGMEVLLIDDFSREELLSDMDALKGDEIVFYFVVYSDNKGNRFRPGVLLKDICSRSAAPVYSYWSSLMGTGIAGGFMLDGSKISTEMFRAAEDFMTKGSFSDDYSASQSYLDWNAVKVHKLEVDGTDERIRILNRPAPFFTTYYKQILSLGITVMALFLTLSLVSRYRISKAHRKLEQQMEEIKQLRGIIPICSYCKKIRNDDGYWDQVEKYISQHSEALFSHGICPDCYEKYTKKELEDLQGRYSKNRPREE